MVHLRFLTESYGNCIYPRGHEELEDTSRPISRLRLSNILCPAYLTKTIKPFNLKLSILTFSLTCSRHRGHHRRASGCLRSEGAGGGDRRPGTWS
jgi:hypothetical protein